MNMHQQKIFSGKTKEEVWLQLETDLRGIDNILDYSAVLQIGDNSILLEIIMDPGGGFESSYGRTRLRVLVNTKDEFTFAIYEEKFLDTAGKLFGMQDVIIGYPEIDDRLIVKTNNENRIKEIFADVTVQNILAAVDHFRFFLTNSEDKGSFQESATLELIIEEAITEPSKLQKIIDSFISVLYFIGSTK